MDPSPRDIVENMFACEGTGSAWGIEIEDVAAGYARIRMVVRADMLNGHHIAHGGMIFALADTACAYAANSRNSLAVTQQASVQFLGQAREGDCLIAEATELATVGRSGSYRVVVRTKAGMIIAEFSGLTRQISGEVVLKIDEGQSDA